MPESAGEEAVCYLYSCHDGEVLALLPETMLFLIALIFLVMVCDGVVPCLHAGYPMIVNSFF